MSGLTASAFKKFKQNYFGIASLCFVIFVGFMAIFAYVFAPDDSQYANQMHLSIHSKPPGFEVSMLIQPNASPNPQSLIDKLFFGDKYPAKEVPILSYQIQQKKLSYQPYNPTGLEGLEKVIDLVAFPKVHVENKKFYLGTDKFGRDLLSRILVGARISFFIGFIAVSISLLLGLLLGSLAGYYGGRIDAMIMWLINVTWSIPTLLLVIAITLALGKGFWQVFIAVGLTMWVEVARVVRGEVMSVKEQQYITAARALGFSDFRIIFKHILPNIMAPVIVISAANFAAAILIESGLSFFGHWCTAPNV
jgi:peptide/nickel transport system permease protein